MEAQHLRQGLISEARDILDFASAQGRELTSAENVVLDRIERALIELHRDAVANAPRCGGCGRPLP